MVGGVGVVTVPVVVLVLNIVFGMNEVVDLRISISFVNGGDWRPTTRSRRGRNESLTTTQSTGLD